MDIPLHNTDIRVRFLYLPAFLVCIRYASLKLADESRFFTLEAVIFFVSIRKEITVRHPLIKYH